MWSIFPCRHAHCDDSSPGNHPFVLGRGSSRVSWWHSCLMVAPSLCCHQWALPSRVGVLTPCLRSTPLRSTCHPGRGSWGSLSSWRFRCMRSGPGILFGHRPQSRLAPLCASVPIFEDNSWCGHRGGPCGQTWSSSALIHNSAHNWSESRASTQNRSAQARNWNGDTRTNKM